MLYLIGGGLYDEMDLTFRAKKIIDTCKHVYLEGYTSLLHTDIEKISEFLGKDVVAVDREFVEKQAEAKLLEPAKEENVALIIIGDVFGATTHMDLYLRAKQQDIEVHVNFNASIMTAIGQVGLELYKFGKTTSMPYFESNYKPKSAYDALQTNQSNGLHTLMLLDIQADKQRFMSVNEAVDQLLQLETEHKQKVVNDDTVAIGCARLGSPQPVIKCATLKELKEFDFGKPLHCLILPGKLHFIEEEALQLWK